MSAPPLARPVGGRRISVVRDASAVSRVLAADPVAGCMVAARVADYGLDPRGIGGELWTRWHAEESLCYAGANLIPLRGGPADMRAFADQALRTTRPQTADEVRSAVDPGVRRVRAEELDAYLVAAIDMFIGEVGIDPRAGDGGRGYRRRVAGLIAAGQAYARFEDGQVVFKAEIGSQSPKVGQIQGVWVHPEWRGHGVGTAGTAAVAAAVLDGGRVASLYVNSFNTVARSAYARVGFVEVGTFATVLLD
ncbi:MAG: GNAT family N-acetyltransferase [Mycobacteriaceae bacterium]|nr:GNAT family N-acetyltransferase [Mycobacteriaceae bacterium]